MKGGTTMQIDTYTSGTVLIAASTLAAVVGLILLRRLGYFRENNVPHEAGGQYLAIVGTLYAIVLGLIVNDAIGRFQTAVTLVADESNALAELIYLAGRMPEPLKLDVHRRAATYAHLVVEREWPVMAQRQQLPEASQACLEVMRVLRDWEPATESEKAIYAVALTAASDFWNARRLRILACQRVIPPLEWFTVILGGVITVVLTYFLVLDDVRIQVALTAMVAVLIALNIFLILMFAYPFSGDLHVSSEGFNIALTALAREPAGALSH